MPNWLARLAISIDADEVVMPDVMGNCEATIAASKAFTRVVKKIWPEHSFGLAGVVQGKTFAEWMKCINAYLYNPEFARVQSIMFPRCMNTGPNNWVERVNFLTGMFESSWWSEMIVEHPVDVHCLGACPWVREVYALAKLPVRSMDTCLPVSLGLDGIDIRKDIYIRRQEGFFDIEARHVDLGLLEVVRDNCRIFAEWAKAPLGAL